MRNSPSKIPEQFVEEEMRSESELIRKIAHRNIKRLLTILIEKEGKEKALYWFEEEVLGKGRNEASQCS